MILLSSRMSSSGRSRSQSAWVYAENMPLQVLGVPLVPPRSFWCSEVLCRARLVHKFVIKLTCPSESPRPPPFHPLIVIKTPWSPQPARLFPRGPGEPRLPLPLKPKPTYPTHRQTCQLPNSSLKSTFLNRKKTNRPPIFYAGFQNGAPPHSPLSFRRSGVHSGSKPSGPSDFGL